MKDIIKTINIKITEHRLKTKLDQLTKLVDQYNQSKDQVAVCEQHHNKQLSYCNLTALRKSLKLYKKIETIDEEILDLQMTLTKIKFNNVVDFNIEEFNLEIIVHGETINCNIVN